MSYTITCIREDTFLMRQKLSGLIGSVCARVCVVASYESWRRQVAKNGNYSVVDN